MWEKQFSEGFLMPKKGGQPYRILLCEDKEINRMMGIYALESLGCLVDTAEDGEEAISLAGNNNYDMIFMDCGMPKMDGYEATTRIKQHHHNKGINTPIVALTGKVMLHDREKCLESGMDDYLPKPARRENLCEAINKWCAPESNILFFNRASVG